ncbi:MAG TPA: hypothetical protein ENI05_13970, partial [Porticoccus sp.]|nr:hypothetical protein [Porticoccus sp.]
MTAGTAAQETALFIGANWDTVLDSANLDISGAGVITGATGITSSGTITFSGLSAGGMMKAAAGTGQLEIATGGTDYENPLTFENGLTRSTDTIRLGGALTQALTTITADATEGIEISSSLGAARSIDVLTITQANTGFDSTGNLLQLNNADTGSTAAVLNISQAAGSGTGINITTGNSTATAIDISSQDIASTGIHIDGDGLLSGGYGILIDGISGSSGRAIELTLDPAGTPITSSGRGIMLNYANLGAGTAVEIGGSISGNLTALTGDYLRIDPTRTHTGAGAIDDAGNYLDITRSNTMNNAGGSFTISGDLATLSSNCIVTLGTCTDTSNILELDQQFATASGAVLNILNSGAGSAVSITDTLTSNKTTAVVSITRPSDATYDSTGNLLQLTNSDTGSTSAVLAISQVWGGAGIQIDHGTSSSISGPLIELRNGFIGSGGSAIKFDIGITDGTGILFTDKGGGFLRGTAISIEDEIDSGTAFDVTTAGYLTSGYGIRFRGDITNNTAFTGDIYGAGFTRTVSSGTLTDTGNFLDLARSNTTSGTGDLTVSGDVATISSTCTQSAGICTDTANILELNQQYATASGAVLNILNAGTGDDININSGALTLNSNDINSTGAITINSTSADLALTTTTSGDITFDATSGNNDYIFNVHKSNGSEFFLSGPIGTVSENNVLCRVNGSGEIGICSNSGGPGPFVRLSPGSADTFGTGAGDTEPGWWIDETQANATPDLFRAQVDGANRLSLANDGSLDHDFALAGTAATSTYYGYQQTFTNTKTANADTIYGGYLSFVDAGTLANTVTGLYVDAATANANDTTYAAAFLNGNVGIGTATPAVLLEVEVVDSNPSSVIEVLRLYHRITAGNGASGIGVGINFSTEGDGGFGTTIGTIEGILFDATNGNEDGGLVFSTRAGGGPTDERLRIGSSTTETVFNEIGADFDLRIEGDTDANLFFVDASTDRVGIGNNAPTVALDVTGEMRVASDAAPTVDIASITNSGFGTTTNNVDALSATIFTATGAGANNSAIHAIIGNAPVDASDVINGLEVTGFAQTVASTTQNLIFLDAAASGNTTGTLNAINIDSITANTATETAINIGSGWDNSINGTGTLGLSSSLTTGTAVSIGNGLATSLSGAYTGLDVDLETNYTPGANNRTGLNVAALTSGTGTSETAINIGSGWDNDLSFACLLYTS